MQGSLTLDDEENPVAQVLNLMYIENQNYIIYNDQTPDGNDHQNRGHTKGEYLCFQI